MFAFATHGLFSGPASDRIARSSLEEVVVTNTIPLAPSSRSNDRIKQLSVAPLLAEAIRRVHLRQSVSDLFKRKNGDFPGSDTVAAVAPNIKAAAKLPPAVAAAAAAPAAVPLKAKPGLSAKP